MAGFGGVMRPCRERRWPGRRWPERRWVVPARSGRRAAAVIAVVVCLGSAAFGADAASPHAELRSKDEIPLFYNQGIARVPRGWILSGTLSPIPDTDVMVRTDEQFNVMVRNDAPIPTEWRTRGYVHVGDIDVVGNVVYAPFEQPDYAQGHQVTARYDARTLRFRDAVELAQHENSFVTVDPATQIAYSMDHFDGDELLRYDVAHKWKPLRPLKLSMLLEHTQGAGIADGAVWISTSDAHNDIYRVNMKTGHVDLVAQITDPPGEGEGLAVVQLPSGSLHATVLDPDQTKVWVEHFSRPTSGRRGT
jgi:hypothetical protein